MLPAATARTCRGASHLLGLVERSSTSPLAQSMLITEKCKSANEFLLPISEFLQVGQRIFIADQRQKIILPGERRRGLERGEAEWRPQVRA